MENGKQLDKKLAILEVLSTSSTPLSGLRITDALEDAGHRISERTVRLYLQTLDAEGLTEARGKRGRVITARGRYELKGANVLRRVGYMSARIDQLTFQMDFDLALRSGRVVVNVALVSAEDLRAFVRPVCEVYECGYAMGTLVGLLPPGERIGDTVVRPGQLGLCTVCSITLNGVLLKHGVPTRSLFSGLLQMRNWEAEGFTEVINYDGTTIDPLELFIRSRMTDYGGAVTTGGGKIGAGFREVPASSYDRVISLTEKLDRIGLGGFLKVGRPGQPLLNIPVNEGCSGAIVIGGLNPVARFEEADVRVEAYALAGLMEYNRLFHYSELEERLGSIRSA
jgi:repressor of nif and glnA expression